MVNSIIGENKMITILMVWFVSVCLSFAILGRQISLAMDVTPKGTVIEIGPYIFMAIVSIILGPLWTAFLIGLLHSGATK